MKNSLDSLVQAEQNIEKVKKGEMRYSLIGCCFMPTLEKEDKDSVQVIDIIYRSYLSAFINANSIKIASANKNSKEVIINKNIKEHIKRYFFAKCLKKSSYQTFDEFISNATQDQCKCAFEKLKKFATKIHEGTFKSSEAKGKTP
jgi:DNA replication protein DnaC